MSDETRMTLLHSSTNDLIEELLMWRGLAAEHLDRIAELEAAQQKAIALLPKLERGHYYCDDCRYSCPKAVEGCCDESQGDECNCGADKYNQLLSEIISLLTPPEVQE